MTNNNSHPALKTAFFTMLLLLNLAPALRAQNRRYVTEQHFVQRLVWVGDEYVFRYEVIIERDEGQGYRRYKQETTESPRLQINLPMGNYRYQVIPYDFLDQPGEASDWVTLDVRPETIISVEVQQVGDSFTLSPIDHGQLVPGVNGIIIKNPDELEKKEGVITVEKPEAPGPEKLVDMYLGAAWIPLFPIHGGIQQLFGSKLFLSGAAIRFGVLFTKSKQINLGLELLTSWYALDKASGDSSIDTQTGVMGLNILMQTPTFNQKIAYTIRAGGGFVFQVSDISSKQETYFLDRLSPHVSLDLAFLWLALKYTYVETGFNYIYFLAKNNPSGCLRPWVSIGCRF
ncbi:MAG: hypothetical protein LBH20_04365 [Treponema sp.]|jgi:hypothetical protein|nr:hypothetical protein [Treponema sp.]